MKRTMNAPIPMNTEVPDIPFDSVLVSNAESVSISMMFAVIKGEEV